MDLSTFVTLLTLAVAVYTFLPRSRRLSLLLKVRWTDWLFVTIIILAIHYLLFIQFFASFGLVPSWLDMSKAPFIAYGLFTLAAVILYVSVRTATLPLGRIGNVRQLVEELLATKEQHAELLSILDDHLSRLAHACGANFFLSRLKRWIAKKYPDDIPGLLRYIQETGGTEGFPKPNFWARLIRRIGELLPEKEEKAQSFCHLLRLALFNESFVDSLVRLRPYFGIKILELDVREIRYEFSDHFLRALLLNRSSVLYWEIKNNQNTMAVHRYAIPETNQLLFYLFRNVKTAKSLGAWQPVGEHAISVLDSLTLSSQPDPYNHPLLDYREREQWECPLFISIRFFDIMISEAINQNVRDHMWLYYFRYFVERICRNSRVEAFDDSSIDEWPSRYSYLLYEIVSAQVRWIETITEIDRTQENSILESTDPTEDGGNPIKSSILCLADCAYLFLTCENLSFRFRKYLIDIVLRSYLKLRADEELEDYAECFWKAILQGGSYERTPFNKYLGNLLKAFVERDNVPYETEHVEEAMSSIANKLVKGHGHGELENWVEVEETGGRTLLRSRFGHAYEVALDGF